MPERGSWVSFRAAWVCAPISYAEKATEGVECRKDSAVIDEIPMAYKDIDAVIHAQRDLVEVVHILRQVVCFKG